MDSHSPRAPERAPVGCPTDPWKVPELTTESMDPQKLNLFAAAEMCRWICSQLGSLWVEWVEWRGGEGLILQDFWGIPVIIGFFLGIQKIIQVMDDLKISPWWLGAFHFRKHPVLRVAGTHRRWTIWQSVLAGCHEFDQKHRPISSPNPVVFGGLYNSYSILSCPSIIVLFLSS